MVSRKERLGFQRGFLVKVLKFLAKIVKIDYFLDFLEFIKGL